jgi:UDP-N-acetylglucosamine 2-epimerase
MGEDDWRIHVVGSTYVDRILQGMYVPAGEARASVGLDPEEPFLLVIVHPETYRSRDGNRELAECVLTAAAKTGLRSVVTYPCSDPGYDGIVGALTGRAQDPAFLVHRNIDNDVYLGLMSTAAAIVGNSSAALVEAPYFRLPAVNVGRRQDGRARDDNVVDAPAESSRIEEALARALDPSFRASVTLGRRLGDGRAAERIVSVLKETPLDDRLRRKQLSY